MPRKRIVLVESRSDTAELIAYRLDREGNDVETAPSGKEGLELIKANPPDLAIIDADLPDMSGSQVVREMRTESRAVTTAVIMLTNEETLDDSVAALKSGRDEYVGKPFSMSVLATKAADVLRRVAQPRASQSGKIKIGDVSLDEDTHKVEVAGHPIGLTLTEFRLLAALAAAKGRVLTRDQLIDQAMGMDAIITNRTVDVHLTSLRKKLDKAGKCLKTVRGVGYRIVGDEK